MKERDFRSITCIFLDSYPTAEIRVEKWNVWYEVLKYFPAEIYRNIAQEWLVNNPFEPSLSHTIDFLEKHYEGCRKVYWNARIRLLTDYDGRYSEFEGYKEEDTWEQKTVIFDGEIEKRQVGITDCIKYLDLIAKIRRGDF